MEQDRRRTLEQALARKYRELDTVLAEEGRPGGSGGTVAPATLQQEVEQLEAQLLAIWQAPSGLDEEQRRTIEERLALPHWFSLPMLSLLLPADLAVEPAEVLGELLDFRVVEDVPHRSGCYRVPERRRVGLVRVWERQRSEDPVFRALSQRLAEHCGQQVAQAGSEEERVEWRMEHLYHLVVADSAAARAEMEVWFDEAIGSPDRFDLNQGHCSLYALEERRHLLRSTYPDLLDEVRRRRNYLSARAYWTEEWYKTIPYLPRAELVEQLDRFFRTPEAEQEGQWILNLYADGGAGKTALIEWMVARYALPRGYVCARFDYDGDDLLAVAQDPARILVKLAENLNAQLAYKKSALESLGELRGDPVGDFMLLLGEAYPDQIVIFFVDTVEVLLEQTAESEAHLERLLRMLRRIREGDEGGTIQGQTTLRVVLSGRQNLLERYESVARAVFDSEGDGRPLPMAAWPVPCFTRAEGEIYLREKRRLPDQPDGLIGAILDKATDAGPDGQAQIIPLKLAMYADMVKHARNITVQEVREAEEVDLLYLVKRILERIEQRDLHWLLRYGVIFRRLDAAAAEALLPFMAAARAGSQEWDEPELDPEAVRAALAQSRRLQEPMEAVETLLHQLTQYSWVSRIATRTGQIISFHPTVKQPQLAVLRGQRRLFPQLQEAAHNHYHARAEQADDLERKAQFLREAVYHGFQQGSAGADYWRHQIRKYRHGWAPVVQALVDEAFHASGEESAPFFGAGDYQEGYLALAQELLESGGTPHEAAGATEQALRVAGEAGNVEGLYLGSYLQAQIQMARNQLVEALDAAGRCLTLAKKLDPGAEAAALAMLGAAQAANSRWKEARETLRAAYRRSQEALGRESYTVVAGLPPGPQIHQRILTHCVENLRGSADWLEAQVLLVDALNRFPDVPDLLAQAARLALDKARLQEAAKLFERAIVRSDGEPQARLAAQGQAIRIFQGELPDEETWQDPESAQRALVARADWARLGERLRNLDGSLETVADENTSLAQLNLRLQFVLEVEGNRREVQELLRQGESWVTTLPSSHPEVGRFLLLRRFVEFLDERIELLPEPARQTCERRLAEATQLDTPEDRVRAKALLLVVRAFAAVEVGAQDAQQQQAAAIYGQCAADALVQALDLLLGLAPYDQVDVMRTLVALPGWSSGLANHLSPHGAERTPVRLLHHALESPARAFQPSPLARLIQDAGLAIGDRLAALAQQVQESGSDWPLLYTSCVRLLAVCGEAQAASALLAEAPIDLDQPDLAPLPVLDRAWLSSWPEAVELLETKIRRLEQEPGATGLSREILLSGAYLGLVRSSAGEADQSGILEQVTGWLARLEEQSLRPGNGTLSMLELLLLQAVAAIQAGVRNGQRVVDRDGILAALGRLKDAAQVAKTLGDTAAFDSVEQCHHRLQELQLRTPASYDDPALVEVLEPGSLEPDVLTIWLEVEQRDESSIETAVRVVGWPDVYRGESRLERVQERFRWTNEEVLPLPDQNEWHKLLLAFGPQDVGAALLDDLWPAAAHDDQAFQAFLREHVSAPGTSALRLTMKGPAVEDLPWDLLYFDDYDEWAGRLLCLSINRPPEDGPVFSGASIAFPARSDRTILDHLLVRELQLYRPREIYDSGQLGRVDALAKGSGAIVIGYPSPLKSVHLLGYLRHQSEREGILLDMDGYQGKGSRLEFNAGRLAHALRSDGLDQSLIILEALTTGSSVEDLRAYQLRNRYALALARLGLGAVLATGPRRPMEDDEGTNAMIAQIRETESLAGPQLEELVREACRHSRPPVFGEEWQAPLCLFYSSPV